MRQFSVIFIAIIFLPSVITAMEKMAVEINEEELPYELSKQEQDIERHRIFDLVCDLCQGDTPPKLGIPLLNVKQLPSESLETVTKKLQHSIAHHNDKAFHWHERYHRAMLLTSGAKITENEQASLLHNAVELGDYMLVQFYLQHGIDANIKNRFNTNTPLFSVRSLPLVKLLVKYGADIHAKNKHNEVALHYATSLPKAHGDLLVYYIMHGVPIASVSDYNSTALHHIAYNLNTDEMDNNNTIQKACFLLHAGIPLNIKNNNKQTAEDYLRVLLNKNIENDKKGIPNEVAYFEIKEKAIRQILKLIKVERNQRAILLQPWHTFLIGWQDDVHAVHSCLPIEIIRHIFPLFKASILKDRIKNWITIYQLSLKQPKTT